MNKVLGYNGYKFKPEDWIEPDCWNRLSTCRGKYHRQQYGSLKQEQLIGMFYDFCPYEIVWNVPSTTYCFNSVSNSTISRQWMAENIKGYWRDLNFMDEVSDGTSIGIHRSAVKFQLEEDAILFKLTWVTDNGN